MSADPRQLDSRMADKRNGLLNDLVALAERTLQDYGIPAPAATIAANALADRLADHWGGQNFSFPKEYRRKLAKLELELYDRFTGRNYDELAMAYSMTERGVRKLIARVRERVASAGQAGLFDPPGE